MAETAEKRTRVVIIGAGITGMFLAQGLQESGAYDVQLYDKEAYIGERVREWTMLLHWALPTLQSLLPESILKDMRSIYTDPFYPYDKEVERVPFFNAMTGDMVFETPASSMRRVSRTKTRTLFSRGLNIHWSKAFKELKKSAYGPLKVVFEDGETVEADLVVGADGPNSRVRRALLGEEAGKARPSDHAIFSGIINYNDAEKAKYIRVHPVASAGLTPIGSLYLGVQNVPDPDKPETWAFHLVRIWKDKVESLEGDEAAAKIKDVSKDLKDPPFYTAIQGIPNGSKVFITQMHYWATVPWGCADSRVVLAGDAAHAMLPSRGQGLNHALEDVKKLVDQLADVRSGGASLTQALQKYEDEVVARGSKAALGSLEDAEANMRIQFKANPLAQRGIAE